MHARRGVGLRGPAVGGTRGHIHAKRKGTLMEQGQLGQERPGGGTSKGMSMVAANDPALATACSTGAQQDLWVHATMSGP